VERAKTGPYRLPPLDMLNSPVPAVNSLDRPILEQTAGKIEETLRHFKIDARVVEVQKGPTITQYEVSLAAGIKVHKIMNLADDLAMALKAPSIRIVAPIPGKSTVGIEVPNRNRSTVGLRELIESPEFRDEEFKLPLALGKDVAGTPVIGDLGEMPHLLIAGSTGSGKSVSINSIIINLLLTRTPDEVKMILVDPKMVELAPFENIPHLLSPVVTDMKKAPAILGWTVEKMDERYELLAMAGVRHITSYNALGREKLRERLQGKVDEADLDGFPEHLPFIVVIIDELADLMMTASKEVEASITRLSQKSRAVGIHVILATQRPSVDVITGLIKANMPSRISFHVASKVDSRTILDRNGAEKLLGKGDLLYLPPGTSALLRVQGTFVSDKEIREVVEFVTRQAEPQFNPELTKFGVDGARDGTEEDELYEEAVRVVLGSQRGSVTLLQRQLEIGYTRASRLMEIMHESGLVGPFKGSKAREVYYTLEEWEEANARRASASAKSPDGGGRAAGDDPGED
jgi:S-DNA-T family DNA segregation ATPase FtsK/SpoIIIE